ncbi:MAG: DoxX family protein [Acidobacteriia bacterium]|nr:DoxX family protein [Terriglobia bacterium]
MQSATQTTSVSKQALWAGRIITGLVAALLLFDAIVKVMKLAPAMEGTVKLGYPASVVLPLGIVLLACVVLYAIPRTSVLGAILLTGYLGGAVATQVRVEDPLFLFPIGFGVLVWGGLYLRDRQLRALIPMRNPVEDLIIE